MKMLIRHENGLRSIPANMLWTILGQISYNLAQWIMILILTRLKGVTSVGLLTLAFSISAPIIMLFNLRMNLVSMSDAKQEYSFIDYFILRLLTTLISLILIIVLSLYLYNEHKLIIILIGCAKSFEAISDICYALIRKHEHTMYIALSQFLKGLLMLTSFSITLYITHTLDIACFFIALSWLLILILFDWPVALKMTSTINTTKNIYRHFHQNIFQKRNFAKIKKLIHLGIPLGIVAGLNSVNTNIPKYFVSKFLGNEMLGYFTPLNYIFNVTLVIVGLLLTTTIPRLVRYYIDYEYKKFHRLILQIIILSSIVGMISMLITYFFSSQIVGLIFGEVYSRYSYILVYLMLAAMFNYIAIIFIYLLTAMRFLNIQIIIFSLGVLITTALNYLYVRDYQLIGAAVAEIFGGLWLMLGLSVAFFYSTKQHWKSRWYAEKWQKLTQ